jgi:hypothetical protein
LKYFQKAKANSCGSVISAFPPIPFDLLSKYWYIVDLIGIELLSFKYSRIPPTYDATCGIPRPKHSNTVNSNPPPLQLLQPTSQQL